MRRKMFGGVWMTDGFFRRAGSHGSTAGRMPAATPGNGFGRDAENGHRDGRAPQQCLSWWPCASTGQWRFGVDERGNGRLNFQPQMDTDKHGFFQARQG